MTNFSWIDGSIVGLYIVATMIAGIAVRKYVGKVEHFLIAGREMNLYLGIASLAATEFGIVTCMYTSQNGYRNGFAGATPGILAMLAMFFVGYTGFCVKPLRDAGVITIPELFEKRYGPRIRWAAGVVIVLGGLLNMGVFLRTGGDFLVAVCGFDPKYLEITMTALLVFVAIYTVLGGMLSVLVTDFLQFVVMSGGLLAVTILILVNVGWTDLVAAVQKNYGAGGFNPLVKPDMGWKYIADNALLSLAMVLTWQTTIQRLLAAKDTKTGCQVYTRTSVFFLCRWLIPVLWGIAALAVLDPAEIGDNTLLAMPTMLSRLTPVGLMGILVAAMLAADMSTDASYMLTWSSVIYNDILAPFHKNQWSEKRGLIVSRSLVAIIGVFLLVYGLWYPLQGSLWDYLRVTGNIYLSSMSVLLVACCYWKRANSWGAAGAIICGAVIPTAFLVMEQLPSTRHFAKEVVGPEYSNIGTYIVVTAAMVIGSLLKPQTKPVAAKGY
ncbi:MAG TPA: sodium:solute symporter family protein [Candidatus Hydrogenedentes bacterium]|jgi:SSS family solute:Na+ symporter|nr:sodium:solute symporter family protein [Candidatus Hydrogenedentota bacterium]MDY0031592.1 sodium:solute symporter family protein [FCB group bacterium]HNZ17307.1 sodium:solute symporter family protein [Candidatus Hydrogenedentota bacterium]HOH33021.1 sodium:solute symporter family protein [Candidatus Hydrogenedentota bacterium]HPA02951.1 sodium:solute symporter family protein [Candidatus Hydrogenedentota bacterium]